MFSANSELELLFLLSAGIHAKLDQLAYTALVDALEWVSRKNPGFDIVR